MDSGKIGQLTGLRNYLINNRVRLELDSIENYMADFLTDRELKTLLMNPIAAESIWYTLCNNGANRDKLIAQLYEILTHRYKKGENESLELIKYALFLGGVDGQLSPIAKPPKAHQGGGRNIVGTPIRNKGSIVGKSVTLNGGHLVRIIIAVVVLLAVIMTVRFCGSKSHRGSDHNLYSAQDVCRVYEGNIEKGETKTTYRMSVSVENSDKLMIRLTDVFNSNHKEEYVGYIKIEKLILINGPELLIQKTSQDKVTLSCNDKSLGKWNFVSI